MATGGWRGGGAARGRRNTAGESDTGGEGPGELRWEVDGRRQSLRRRYTPVFYGVAHGHYFCPRRGVPRGIWGGGVLLRGATGPKLLVPV